MDHLWTTRNVRKRTPRPWPNVPPWRSTSLDLPKRLPHRPGGQGVVGSNPASPTVKPQVNALIVDHPSSGLAGRDPNRDPNCELDHNGPQRTSADPSRLFDPTTPELADAYPPRCERSTGPLADWLSPGRKVERVKHGTEAPSDDDRPHDATRSLTLGQAAVLELAGARQFRRRHLTRRGKVLRHPRVLKVEFPGPARMRHQLLLWAACAPAAHPGPTRTPECAPAWRTTGVARADDPGHGPGDPG
jgi:hypothetical protein